MVLGGLLIAAAAVLVFAAVVSTRNHSLSYVVAGRPLATGSIIGPGDTTTEALDLPGATANKAFASTAVVIGRKLQVGVSPGELIESSMLAPDSGAAKLRPVSITVDSASLSGLTPGAPVDVLAVPSGGAGNGLALPSGAAGNGPAGTGTSASNGTGTSNNGGAGTNNSGGAGTGNSGGIVVVFRGASLLSVARPGSGLSAVPVSGTVVTLGVTTLDEVEMLVQASHAGTVILVEATPADGVGPGPGPGG